MTHVVVVATATATATVMVWYGMVWWVGAASCLVKEGSGSGITRIPTDEPSPKPLSIKASSSYLRGWAWLLFFFQSFSLSVFLFSLSLFPETKRKPSPRGFAQEMSMEMLGKCWVSRQFFSCFVFSIDGVKSPCHLCVCVVCTYNMCFLHLWFPPSGSSFKPERG